MGTVNISAHGLLNKGGIQAVEGVPLLSENVTSSGTSAQSSAMPSGTDVVRIATDTTVRVLVGSNPTALATSMRVYANTVDHFTVREGHKVAVIDE